MEEKMMQPAKVTDEPDLTSGIVNDACWKFVEAMPHQLPGPIWNDLKPALYKSLIHYHRAILALRPVQVPMTREQAMAIAQSNPDTMTAIRMAEAHHGITAQAKKETP